MANSTIKHELQIGQTTFSIGGLEFTAGEYGRYYKTVDVTAAIPAGAKLLSVGTPSFDADEVAAVQISNENSAKVVLTVSTARTLAPTRSLILFYYY